MRVVNSLRTLTAESPQGSLSHFPGGSVQKTVRVRFPHFITIKNRFVFPCANYRLVASLPKIQRRNIFICIVPNQPPLLYRNFNGKKGQNFAETINDYYQNPCRYCKADRPQQHRNFHRAIFLILE